MIERAAGREKLLMWRALFLTRTEGSKPWLSPVSSLPAVLASKNRPRTCRVRSVGRRVLGHWETWSGLLSSRLVWGGCLGLSVSAAFFEVGDGHLLLRLFSQCQSRETGTLVAVQSQVSLHFYFDQSCIWGGMTSACGFDLYTRHPRLCPPVDESSF